MAKENEREYRVRELQARLSSAIARLETLGARMLFAGDSVRELTTIVELLSLVHIDARYISEQTARVRELEKLIGEAADALTATRDHARSADLIGSDAYYQVTDTIDRMRAAVAPPVPSQRVVIGEVGFISHDFGNALRERESLRQFHHMLSEKVAELAARRCPRCAGPMELDQVTISAMIGASTGVGEYSIPLRCKAGCRP